MNKPLRVLLVEDSENDAVLLVRELRRGGYDTVSERVDSAEAMNSALSAGQWDIVISDYVIPGFSGLEALAILKQTHCDIPFIIVSGRIGEDIAVAAMKAGADDYIMKTNLKRLVAAIERELREVDNRRRRRQAEQALIRSEASLAEAQRMAHMGNWEWDISKNNLCVSDEMCRILGLPQREMAATSRSLLNYIHAGDQKLVEKTVSEALRHGKPFSIDHRVILRDGTERVVHTKGRGTLDDAGQPLRMVGTVQDITERRRAEDVLRALSRRLVTQQEDQCRIIAHELHDQFGQTLTVLKILLDRIKRLPAEKNGPALEQSRALTDELFNKVHDMSLNLRPPMLDDLGLLPALVWHLDRCRSQLQMRIEFEHSGLEKSLPGEVTTAAYRIIQEALNNLLRHAGVKEARVTACVREDVLYLAIQDEGVGFDPASLSSGLGLSGMRERAALLGGVLTVESSPGLGTKVSAELPLSRYKNTEERRHDYNTVGR